MNRNLLLILTIIAFTGCRSDKDLKLWYDSPASIWEATLPLGNGRLGMMPDGNQSKENIVLNEITLWSGSVQDATNPTAREYLPQIRQLLLEGRNDLAQELMYEHFVCGGVGSGYGSGKDVPFGCYQVLGNLHLDFAETEDRKSTRLNSSHTATSRMPSSA